MDKLDYEFHLDYYKGLYNLKSPNIPESNGVELDAHVVKEAQYAHAWSVFNPLRDLAFNTNIISQKLTQKKAKKYLLNGAGRRLHMMFYAFQEILNSASPKRTKPLSFDQQMSVTKELNIFYINLSGVLDNFAWCLLFEKQPADLEKIKPINVGLFSNDFRKKFFPFYKIKIEIEKHDEWNIEIKTRRDPVAHRIPLYIPPTILTKEEGKIYQNLQSKHLEKATELDFEQAESVFQKMHEMGSFYPFFVHDPDEPHIPLYPTIATDIAHLVRISNIIEKALLT